MIPLKRYPEPPKFVEDVRQPGQKYLGKQGIKLLDIGVETSKFYPYWTKCKNDLEKLYNFYCAYTCFHMHPTEYSTIDHIRPKTCVEAYLAYEWKNYCLCCEAINTKKGKKLNIIDPYKVTANLFCLRLETGYIYANLSHPDCQAAQQTIDGLDLNNERWKKYRQDAYVGFKKDRKSGTALERAEENLKNKNIFVWYEAKRQGKLL